MVFTEQEVQLYLRQKFQGRESFLENIIFPIFGEERFENGFDDPVLEGENDLKAAAEKCGIETIIRYGDIQIDLGSIHLFEITVSNRVLLKRNRVNVQRIVRRIMGTYTGAFMIFHYDDAKAWDWRFSFCCKDDKNFTEAKRYTFLLGENQPCRTAAQNFCTLAKVRGEGRVPALTDIVDAFDVEAVSRDFFNRYKDQYEKFVRYITGKYFKKENGKLVEKDEGSSNKAMYADFNYDDKAVRDFVKKLLGRIVFLHFLQKKGWMGAKKGWSDGDPDFLLELYHKASDKQKGDFLDSVLKPLFNAALDTDRCAQDDFFDTGVVGVGKVRIPYLNGGLFTQDKADEVKSVFPREYFHDLLAFFSEYNFTIDENDPNDAEVGVDPEMLSRIFENLLEDNREKGAFYTLKVVVDHMCRRSLTFYLCAGQSEADCRKIEHFVLTHDAEKLPKKLAATILKRLKDVKVCDPAIGSGAFPMGMLKLIYLCRIALGDETEPSTLKKEIIEENIYGVDIEKGAVDIARLRFWLALVVDEETPRALPNLDFKIMQGNSLLENYKGVDLSELLLGNVTSSKKKPKQGKLALGKFTQSISQGELAFGGDISARLITDKMRTYYSATDHQAKMQLMREIADQVKGYIKAQINNSRLNPEIDALDAQNDKFFLWRTWFNDVFAHGGFDIVIGNPPYIRPHRLSSDMKKALWKCFSTFEKKADIYVCFMQQGIELLKEGGVLTYIVSDGWLRLDSFEKIRRYILETTNVREIVDFAEDIFESATVKTCIVSAVRSGCESEDAEIQVASVNNADDLQQLTFATIPQKIYCESYKNVFDLSYDEGLSKIKQKMQKGASKIGEVFELSFGVKTGDDEKFLTFTPKGDLCKKILRGSDIGRYCHKFKGEYVIYDPVAMRKNKITARPGNSERFEQPKVLMRDTGGGLIGDFDDGNYYQKDVIILTDKNKNKDRLKVLLALLNSRLMKFYYETTFPTLHVQRDELAVLPVLKSYIDKPNKQIVALVDKILKEKNANPDADTSTLESQIDKLVFDLYDLSDDERLQVTGDLK